MKIKPLNVKGDLSMNVIVVAVIALMVMVILIMIFSGRMRTAGSDLENTQSQFSLTKCEGGGYDRKCQPTKCTAPYSNHISFLDNSCKTKETDETNYYCCQKDD